MRTPVELRFEKGDPVREYWLARGEGFAVENRRGRVVGQVVDVVVDPERQRVMSLVVQKARGVSELPVEEIEAVVPARDTFVLDGVKQKPRREKTRRPRGERLKRARAWAVPRVRRAAALVAAFAVAASRAVADWVVGTTRLLAGELRRRSQ